MEKIDRLGWAAGISFASYGVRVGVRANSPLALRLARDYLPPGWKASSSRLVDRLYSLILPTNGASRAMRRFNLLYGDIARLARTTDSEEALEVLASDLQRYVAEMAIDRVFVHAGVVAWRDTAILLPGRSNTGKTTLVAEFVKAGATYYSDEFAVLDKRGRVHPFAGALQIRDSKTGKQTRHSVEQFGGHAGTKPLPVSLVVLTKYRAGTRWRPTRLSSGQGVLEILAQTVSARRQPRRALITLEKVATHAAVLKGARGEATDVIDWVFTYVDDACSSNSKPRRPGRRRSKP
ncbi:MAG TPA: hypothetical protein VGQ72_13260 [Pyrinomonadaceae bacterium]|nr:hypothetical protein [Pyrinomonadaceae bacterium]